MTPAQIEQAKLHANYWNGLAIATMVIGVLPLFLETGGAPPNPDLAVVIMEVFGRLGFAVPLSLLFHAAAIRSVRGL